MSDKVGRNDPCPCGSGLKYKKCCLRKEREARRGLQLVVARRRKKLEEDVWSLRRPLPIEGEGA